MKNTVVISAMAAAGKSTFTNLPAVQDLVISDTDSSKYNFKMNDVGQYLDSSGNVTTDMDKRVKNPNFMRDYITAIKSKIGMVDILFVSAHEPVRQALGNAGIEFIYFTYKDSMKQEVVNRIRERKSQQPNNVIADVHEKLWDNMMVNKHAGNPKKVIELGSGEFIVDYIAL